MKKIYIPILLMLVTALALAEVMNEDGKAARTGSPGEFDCTGCHTSFAVNSGPGSITISSPNLSNWEYVLGQTYQINVTISQATIPLFGFGFEALRTSNNTNGGTFSITNSAETQLKTAVVNGSSRTNVVHKLDGGLSANTHTFSFNWNAPATNIGNIMFYVAGNASDNQGDSLNDWVYKTTQLVTPFTTGIKESLSTQELSVFPNPVHRLLNINLEANSSGNYHFQLMDAKGIAVLNENNKNFNAVGTTQIRLPEQLQNGIYFLRVTDANNKSLTTKVFVYN